MVVWRTDGLTAIFEQEEKAQPFEPGKPLIKVDKNLRYMGYVIDTVPEQHPHTGWQGIYSIVASPIPRSVLPNKPGLHAFPLRNYISGLPRAPTWSWTCSAVCDFYLIGGYWIVAVGGFLFGIVASIGNRLLRSPMTIRDALYYGLLAMTLFIGLRAVREVFILGLGILALWGLFYLRQVLFKRWHISSDIRHHTSR
jgi:hypothetical protein